MDYNNGFSLSFFFNLFLSFLWIGAQFPQEKFLSYARILTLHYYFLLMCILFSRAVGGLLQQHNGSKASGHLITPSMLTVCPRGERKEEITNHRSLGLAASKRKDDC